MGAESIVEIVQRALTPDFDMGWDFFLATVPLVLALVLFRNNKAYAPLRWLGFLLFLLFLPNAAYPVTDFLHFVMKVRQRPYLPAWAIGFIVFPEYVLYIGTSFVAYALAVRLSVDYWRRPGRSGWPVVLETLLHGLCAVGIYLGRVARLNSWDALTRPLTVLEKSAQGFDRPRAVLFIVVTAAGLAAGYRGVWYLMDVLRQRRTGVGSREQTLLDQAGLEFGRDEEGRIFLRRKGLAWPPPAPQEMERRTHRPIGTIFRKRSAAPPRPDR